MNLQLITPRSTTGSGAFTYTSSDLDVATN